MQSYPESLQFAATFQSVNNKKMTTSRSARNVYSELMALRNLEEHYVHSLLNNLFKMDFPASELAPLIKQQRAMNSALKKIVIKTGQDVEMQKLNQAEGSPPNESMVEDVEMQKLNQAKGTPPNESMVEDVENQAEGSPPDESMVVVDHYLYEVNK